MLRLYETLLTCAFAFSNCDDVTYCLADVSKEAEDDSGDAADSEEDSSDGELLRDLE